MLTGVLNYPPRYQTARAAQRDLAGVCRYLYYAWYLNDGRHRDRRFVWGFLIYLVIVLLQNKTLYGVLGAITNFMRAFPFVILMIAMSPFTKAIV